MRARIILSVGNFFFSIFSSLISIILFPYLSLFMPAAYAGFVVAGAAVATIALSPFLPKIIARYGAAQVALVSSLIEMLTVIALAAAPGPLTAILLIGVSVALQPILAYEFDLLLEATLVDATAVGRVRAFFRTAWSIGALAGPLLIAALLATSTSYGRVFMAAVAVIAPVLILLATQPFPKSHPKIFPIRNTLIHIIRHSDLTAVVIGNLLLYLWYVWMPLYTPYYLNTVLGIPWSTLGWIFFVMLIPYVFIEYPAGWIADRYWGDKELMLIGFLIAGASLAALSAFTRETSVTLIAALLVVSRIGSALVEAMVTAHFYRRVSNRDFSAVEVFGGAWPLSYIIAPLVGSTIILFSSYQAFFISTGIFIAIAGTLAALSITDVR